MMKKSLSTSSFLLAAASTLSGRTAVHSFSLNTITPRPLLAAAAAAATTRRSATTLDDGGSSSSSSSISSSTIHYNIDKKDDDDHQHDHHHRYFILRHGETDANASGRIQGSSDISRLTDRGKQQAAHTAVTALDRLYHYNNQASAAVIHQIYVSPLTRAQETLSILRQHATPGRLPTKETVMGELHEIDLYEWEGKHKTDLQMDDAAAFEAWTKGDAHAFEVSGRKPILETWDRADLIWKKLRLQQQQHNAQKNNNNNTLMVCHGTLGQALLCTAFQWDPTHFRKHEFPNCGLVEILWRPEHDVATGWRWHHPEPTELFYPNRDLETRME